MGDKKPPACSFQLTSENEKEKGQRMVLIGSRDSQAQARRGQDALRRGDESRPPTLPPSPTSTPTSSLTPILPIQKSPAMDGVVTAKVERPAPPSKRRRVELMPEQEDGPPASHLSENYRDNAQEDEQEGDVTPIAGSSRARKRRPIVDSDGEGQEDGEASDDVHDASQANSDGAVEEGAEDVYLAEISDEQRKRLSKRGDDG